MNETTQNRLKSPVFWSALIAQVLTLLVYFDVIDMTLSEGLRNIICAALEVLITFGILNNPTNGAGF